MIGSMSKTSAKFLCLICLIIEWCHSIFTSKGKDSVTRKTKMKRMRIISTHTFQIRERFLIENTSTVVPASKMYGYSLFSPFSFDPNSY